MGNGIHLREIIAKGLSAEAIRLHVHESHYHSQSKFSWDSLRAAQNRLDHWQAVAALRWQPQDLANSEPISLLITTARKAILLQLQDNLNTPRALSMIDELFSEIELQLLTKQSAVDFTEFLDFVSATLGIDLQQDEPITDEQRHLISERQAARASSDWAKSDELRDQLAGQGIGLRDTAHGPIWFRV